MDVATLIDVTYRIGTSHPFWPLVVYEVGIIAATNLFKWHTEREGVDVVGNKARCVSPTAALPASGSRGPRHR
ncbi:MAG: hypothetical protein ABSC87_04825 [Halobacteriota archaeon]